MFVGIWETAVIFNPFFNLNQIVKFVLEKQLCLNEIKFTILDLQFFLVDFDGGTFAFWWGGGDQSQLLFRLIWTGSLDQIFFIVLMLALGL